MKRHAFSREVLFLSLFFALSLRAGPLFDLNPDTINNVLDLQLWRAEQVHTFADKHGGQTTVKLVNLAPHVGAWYLLTANWPAVPGKQGPQTAIYHLEASLLKKASVTMLADGKLIVETGGTQALCDILTDSQTSPLRRPLQSGYTDLCNGNLFLRRQMSGDMSTTESVAAALRNNTGVVGEWVINRFKANVTSGWWYAQNAENTLSTPSGTLQRVAGPPSALVAQSNVTSTLRSGIKAAESFSNSPAGAWAPSKDFPGVLVSWITPRLIAPEVFQSFTNRVAPLNDGEKNNMVYLVAIDLKHYSLNWVHGTNLPEVGWGGFINSGSYTRQARNPRGPSGINSLAPLVFPAAVPLSVLPKTMGVFSAGWQLGHSAFTYPPYNSSNNGHHYGFIENGVVMMRPMPNLATVIIYMNGEIEIKAWQVEDEARLGEIRSLRQNGVPVLHANGEPNELIRSWGGGNWSGSAAGNLQSQRSGACIIAANNTRYLVYAYFSSATPSSVARVFQAYQCNSTAIHLDMNSPMHGYLSLFNPVQAGGYDVQHLSPDMAAYDHTIGNRRYPRYVFKADYRDFFYVIRRD